MLMVSNAGPCLGVANHVQGPCSSNGSRIVARQKLWAYWLKADIMHRVMPLHVDDTNLWAPTSSHLLLDLMPLAVQDEEYSGFGGPHCMIKGGYGAITAALAAGLNMRLSCPVVRVSDDSSGVHVTLADGERSSSCSLCCLMQARCWG